MEQKLIAHIVPMISLFADEHQYILVFRSNPAQTVKNGYHTYHRTIADCFEEILSYSTKMNLADGRDKTMEEIASIVEDTVENIRELFKPFEELTLSKKG